MSGADSRSRARGGERGKRGGGAREAVLLVAVINRSDWLESVLEGFLELGVTGATVIDTRDMGSILSAEVPLFAGVRDLVQSSRPSNKTVFAVLRDPDLRGRVLAMIEDVVGGFGRSGSGLVFTIPVEYVSPLPPEPELA